MANRQRFLVVDDEEDGRVLTRYMLKKSFPAAEVVECSSADEALRAMGHTHFDGIIADHHLGRDDSTWFIRQARQADLECPILMVTASSDPAVHRRAYEAGASQVFADGHFDFVVFLRSACSRLPDGQAPA